MAFLRVKVGEVIAYCTRLIAENPQDALDLIKILEGQRSAFNQISKVRFEKGRCSKKVLHHLTYYPTRGNHPDMPAQVTIRAINEVCSSYQTVKSNGHKIIAPILKKRLSMRLDHNLYSRHKTDQYSIRIFAAGKRKTFRMAMYPKLKELIDKHLYHDPLIFVREGELFISLPFDTALPEQKQRLCLGVDLGMRVAAACSDGRLFIDREYNARKRKLRYLKRCLQSKGTPTACRHLRKIGHDERNASKNQTHLIANGILQTVADTIALEDLTGIKKKKTPFQNKNAISQVPLYLLRAIITYKANNAGKHVVLVSPSYTSQIDSLTGKRKGERKGRRFYTKSGLVLDADLNASRNIGHRSKLPVSYGNILDGQGVVTRPIVCKPADLSIVGITSS